jgi:glycopeptide antibiotics resistance protein
MQGSQLISKKPFARMRDLWCFPQDLLRTCLRGLLPAYCVLLLFGTLWPFEFSLQHFDFSQPHRTIEWIPFSYMCPKCGLDWKNKGLNLLMFLPFGFMLGSLHRLKAGTDALAAVTLWGALFSILIELTQYFEPARMTSASDVLMNTLGSLLGAWAAARMCRSLSSDRAAS